MDPCLGLQAYNTRLPLSTVAMDPAVTSLTVLVPLSPLLPLESLVEFLAFLREALGGPAADFVAVCQMLPSRHWRVTFKSESALFLFLRYCDRIGLTALRQQFNRTLCVKDLPAELTDDALKAFFKPYGTVLSLVWDRQYGILTGTRYVEMDLRKHVPSAVSFFGCCGRVTYLQQPRTCFSCGELSHERSSCPFKGKLSPPRRKRKSRFRKPSSPDVSSDSGCTSDAAVTPVRAPTPPVVSQRAVLPTATVSPPAQSSLVPSLSPPLSPRAFPKTVTVLPPAQPSSDTAVPSPSTLVSPRTAPPTALVMSPAQPYMFSLSVIDQIVPPNVPFFDAAAAYATTQLVSPSTVSLKKRRPTPCADRPQKRLFDLELFDPGPIASLDGRLVAQPALHSLAGYILAYLNWPPPIVPTPVFISVFPDPPLVPDYERFYEELRN